MSTKWTRSRKPAFDHLHLILLTCPQWPFAGYGRQFPEGQLSRTFGSPIISAFPLKAVGHLYMYVLNPTDLRGALCMWQMHH